MYSQAKGIGLGDIVCLNVKLFKWEMIYVKGWLSFPRWGHACCIRNSKIVIFGGVINVKDEDKQEFINKYAPPEVFAIETEFSQIQQIENVDMVNPQFHSEQKERSE